MDACGLLTKRQTFIYMKIIAPSAVIFCGLLATDNFATAQTWTPTIAPSNYWTSVVSSADGSTLAALAYMVCYTSTNSGTTWASNSVPAANNNSILAASADGLRLASATSNSGEIDVSTNGGLTWKKSTNYVEAAWQSIVSSADGKTLVATEGGPVVYASTNYGVNWYRLVGLPNPGSDPQLAALSADGSCLLVQVPGTVYTTTNFAKSWSTNVISAAFKSIAASADARKLVGAPYGGNIYTSTNFGAAWIQQTNSPSLLWWSCASSADGTRLAAVSGTAGGAGVIYTSADSGLTWVSNKVPSQQWIKIICSADGNKAVAIVNGNDPVAAGGIWISQTAPSPQLNLSSSNGNLNLSWLVPSTNFVLQQSSALGAGNWTTLTNPPALNLSNLQDQLTLMPTNSSAFFRLTTP
jgi:photosystem II stability/assembly factor-like uncharacterized protein